MTPAALGARGSRQLVMRNRSVNSLSRDRRARSADCVRQP